MNGLIGKRAIYYVTKKQFIIFEIKIKNRLLILLI